MAELIRTANLKACDDFYADLLDAHAGLDDGETHALNARLILILANHIGDRDVLSAAIQMARADNRPRPTTQTGDSP